jgi:ribonuclease T2
MRPRAGSGLAVAFLLLLLLAWPARGRGTPGQFDFYVLSLSWSPSRCETAGGRSREQCASGRHAFVVHGLWPQHELGYPRDCIVPAPRINNTLVRAMLDLMPERGLVIHEWRRHGTCSGLTPDDYFKLVRHAWQRVGIPKIFQKIDAYVIVSPDEVENAFVTANDGLKRDMIAVTCDERRLREVRICLAKDLAFRSCPEIDQNACRRLRLVMPPNRG